MQSFNVTIEKEQAIYLERLTYETGSMKSIIDHMFTSHAKDKDTSLFNSVIWKEYMNDYQKAFTEYDIAKEKLTESLKPIVAEKIGYETEAFGWRMESFDDAIVRIDVYDDEDCACSCAEGK